jgi:hypothetical protein
MLFNHNNEQKKHLTGRRRRSGSSHSGAEEGTPGLDTMFFSLATSTPTCQGKDVSTFQWVMCTEATLQLGKHWCTSYFGDSITLQNHLASKTPPCRRGPAWESSVHSFQMHHIKSVDRRTVAFCRLVRPTIHRRAYLSHQHYRRGGGVARLSHAMIVTHGRAHKLVARWAVFSCHRHTHNCGVVFFDTPLHVIAMLHQNGAPPSWKIQCLVVDKARMNSTMPSPSILIAGSRIDRADDTNSSVLQDLSTGTVPLHSVCATVLNLDYPF